jgi:predicted Zn-dependent protease
VSRPLAAALLVVLLGSLPRGARAQEPSGAPPAGRAAGVSFEETARAAEEAWAAGRSDEAQARFEAGVSLNPLWKDGWWRLGLLHTGAGRFDAARDALLKLVALEPDAGPAWALLGLCEYGLQDYERALAHLWKGRSLGRFDDAGLRREADLHFALLLLRSGDFASAARPLGALAARESDDPRVLAACGLLALRSPRLPEEIPTGQHDLVARAGRAQCAALALRADEARAAFEDVLSRYPQAPGLHLAYGVLLRAEADPKALPTLREEARLSPASAEAHAELAFETLERGVAADALGPAREAVRLGPESAAARLALGRALVASSAVAEGIAELERAESLAPERKDVYVALAQAYARAGRARDVERARARLRDLDGAANDPTH